MKKLSLLLVGLLSIFFVSKAQMAARIVAPQAVPQLHTPDSIVYIDPAGGLNFFRVAPREYVLKGRVKKLTTIGTSGAATLVDDSLNIPTPPAPTSGTVTSVGLTSSDITVGGTSPITGTGTFTLTLPNVNSNVGTFNNITVNAKGQATAASNVGYLTANQTVTLSGDVTGSGTTAITATLANSGVSAGTYGILTVDAKGRATAGKRQETYSGTTNASGIYTVTFGTAYGAAPNIQVNPTNFSSDNQFARVTAISTTGFTVLARLRTDVIGLLPAFSNINGATIDVLVTEK